MAQHRGSSGYASQSSQFGDTTYTKIFVGGLPWEAQVDTMRGYFEQFGEILEAVIIYDRNTGRSKGYGFVTFSDAEAAARACQDPNPMIGGRRTNCNLASLGQKQRLHQGQSQQQGSARHIGFQPPQPFSAFPPQGYPLPQFGYPPPYQDASSFSYPQGMFPYASQAFPSHAGMYGAPAGVGPGNSGVVFGAYPQQPGLSAPQAYQLAQGSPAFQSPAAAAPGMMNMPEYLPTQPLASHGSASTEAATGLAQPESTTGQFSPGSSLPQQFSSHEQSTPFKEPDPV